jgi:hypothetical protein
MGAKMTSRAIRRTVTGGDDESTSQLARCSIDAVGLYQQQRSLAAAAEDHRGRTSELGDDGGMPGRNQAAVQLIGAVPLIGAN